MSIEVKYEMAIMECYSLRRQLKEAYDKCTAIFDALSLVDEYSTNERIQLEKLILNLKQTLENQLEQNTKLSVENFRYENNEKFLQKKLNDKNENLKEITTKYRKIYLNQQQEKFIQDNRIVRTNRMK